MREPPTITAVAWSDNPAVAGSTVLISVTVAEGARLRWMDLMAIKWNQLLTRVWGD